MARKPDPDLARLISAAEDSPWHFLLVRADWHEERGEADLAKACRWLARWKKWPREAPNGRLKWGHLDSSVCGPHACLDCVPGHWGCRDIPDAFEAAVLGMAVWFREGPTYSFFNHLNLALAAPVIRTQDEAFEWARSELGRKPALSRVEVRRGGNQLVKVFLQFKGG